MEVDLHAGGGRGAVQRAVGPQEEGDPLRGAKRPGEGAQEGGEHGPGPAQAVLAVDEEGAARARGAGGQPHPHLARGGGEGAGEVARVLGLVGEGEHLLQAHSHGVQRIEVRHHLALAHRRQLPPPLGREVCLGEALRGPGGVLQQPRDLVAGQAAVAGTDGVPRGEATACGGDPFEPDQSGIGQQAFSGAGSHGRPSPPHGDGGRATAATAALSPAPRRGHG